ncbi:MAG: polymer-forming cytoskeletal protein [Thermoanaerobaculia bacterium]|nr:polymer-forming cytoskeletal protein [Thermoanaerobaculia bacterium]
MSAPTSTRQPDSSSHPAGRTTEIAEGSKVVGEVTGPTGLQVNGEVEGKIHVDSEVVVGASGTVRGEIRARRVKIGGKVFGSVRGLESVAILANGRLEGDVAAPGLSIVDGAFFKGKVEMAGEPQAAAPPRPVQSAALPRAAGGDVKPAASSLPGMRGGSESAS